MSIFISVAAFCEPHLEFTIKEAIKYAKNPENLHFGIVEQSFKDGVGFFPDISEVAKPAKVSRIWFDPVESRGCCWARAQAQELYTDEKWFMQIDSHMTFEQDWDQIFIDHTEGLIVQGKKVVISSYPNPFNFNEAGLPVHHPQPFDVALVHLVKPNYKFEEDTLVLKFKATPIRTTVPFRGWQIGAGCLFAEGRIVKEIPYDPEFYFHGEEQSLSARLFTHGWDVYHIPAMPVYHLYYAPQNGDPKRVLHWDVELNLQRPNYRWVNHNNGAKIRLSHLLQETQDFGIYGLGKERTMKQYFELTGIDYANRVITPKAYQGYWKF